MLDDLEEADLTRRLVYQTRDTFLSGVVPTAAAKVDNWDREGAQCRVVLDTAEIIIKADDVVLTEVVTVLHLDKDQIDVDRRTRLYGVVNPVEAHRALSADDEPMLGTPRVRLVADATPRAHEDRLHLVIRFGPQDGVAAPGTLFEIEEVHGDILACRTPHGHRCSSVSDVASFEPWP